MKCKIREFYSDCGGLYRGKKAVTAVTALKKRHFVNYLVISFKVFQARK